MFANKTRVLLSFREDVLGRARVFSGLKLAEHQMLFASACRGASGSGEILQRGGDQIIQDHMSDVHRLGYGQQARER